MTDATKPAGTLAPEDIRNTLRSLDSGPPSGGPDWEQTITNLMALAKEANQAFDFDQALDYLSTMEEVWNSKGLPEFSIDLRIELHQEKGKSFASKGKLDEAIAEYQKTLDFCRDSQRLPVRSETFIQIGQLMAKQGDHDRALGYLQRAMGAYRRLKDQSGQCRALRNLGVIYVDLGEFEEAEINYDEAVAIAEEIGDRVLYADLVNNLGAILNMKGDWERALERYRESLSIYQDQNEIRKAAYAENNLAITFAEQGMNREAFEFFQRAYKTAVSIKDASLTLIVDINLADLYLKKGALSEAQQHCSKAEKALTDAGRRNGHLVEVKKIAGKLSLQDKQYDRALDHLNQAYETATELGAKYLEAEVLLERGTLFRAMERHLDALADLETSYQIYTNIKAEGKRDQTQEVMNSIEILYLEIFDSMAQKVDHKDKYTKGHSDRVASLALLLAKEVGLRGSALKTVVAAALVHDLGKVRIDDSILKKAGRLTADEFESIKKHPELGIELLRGKEFPWDIRPPALHHHERYDGGGYPHGLKGENIPLGARIICIADVFDALTSDRVYRKAFDVEKALAIMNEDAGTAFDPVLLQRFLAVIASGRADVVINSRTRDDEMFSIWSQCMKDTGEAASGDAVESEQPALV